MGKYSRGIWRYEGPLPIEEVDDFVTAFDQPTPAARRRRPFKRICLNCGAWFRTPPSSKTRTCSKECSSRHRSRIHYDKANAWQDTSAAREAAARTGNLKLGTRAAQRSPKAGRFETNREAKIWMVIAPNGTAKYTVINLKLWCDNNADLFAPYSSYHAYNGLQAIGSTLAGTRKQPSYYWRGWTLAQAPIKPSGA